ncbi:diguanylate cyclase [Actinotalea sp.]|uniref:diguanylate cyclase n=1 Tax=Actinotalea sp. TaxID=1872145 RepID=UPI00356AE37A
MTPEVPADEVLDLLVERIVRYRLDDLTILYCNRSWAEANGGSPGDFVGRAMDEVLTATEQESLRRQIDRIGPHAPLLHDNLTPTRGDGWTEWTDHFLDSGGVHQVVAIGRDVTERRNAELRLAASEERSRELALRDELTGLANRRLLDELLDAALARSRRSGDRLVLSYLDLDGFKAVNDAYGHGAGDDVLREVARRLERSVRTADAIARVGGDEFVVLQECTADGDVCCDRRLEQLLAEPFVIQVGADEVSVECGVSVGSATAGPDSDAAGLVAAADAAMYRVKHHGRASV